MYSINKQIKTQSNYEKTINFIHKKINREINQHKAKRFEKLRWSILNDKYKDAFLSNTRINLFKTCTGSGKSVTSVLWSKYLSIYMNEIFDGFVILSTEYENGTDEIERIINKHGDKVEYVRFEGKNRLCLERETKINDNGVKIKNLIDNGISITKYCENACPYYGSCRYYTNVHNIINSKDKGGIKNWIGVQHQISGILPIYLMHTGDIVLVIDEDFTDAIKNQYKYTVPVLRQNKKFLELLLKEFNDNKVDENHPFRRFVELFNTVIEIFLEDLYTFLTPLRYELIIDIFEEMDIIKGIDDYVLNQLENKAFEYIVDNKIKPFKFIYKEICNFIDNYMLEDPVDNKNIDDWVKSAFIKNQKRFQISFVYYDKFLLNKLFEKDNVRKVIINDATSEQEILNFLFKDVEKIKEYDEDWMYENCEFFQLKKARNGKNIKTKYAQYPKSSLLHKGTFIHLMNDIRSILNKHKKHKILIVSREIESKELKFARMKLSTYISSLGHIDCTFESYPLAGTNEYSDYDVVILLGRPELPQAVLKRQSTLIGMEQQRYRLLYSRNLMVQGMGRIFRGSNHKYVYILTGFDLELNRTITYYKSHTELQQHMEKYVKEIENKKDKKNKTTIILDYLKKNKKIDIKICQNIINVSNYKANNFMNLLFDKGIVKKDIAERGKKIFYI